MQLRLLPGSFSICRVESLTGVDFDDPYVFVGKTDEELSLVCATPKAPESCLDCDHGWKGFRVDNHLDFSLTGILSLITAVLAEQNINIFAVSTFWTDYIFVKEERLAAAIKALEKAGYIFIE